MKIEGASEMVCVCFCGYVWGYIHTIMSFGLILVHDCESFES